LINKIPKNGLSPPITLGKGTIFPQSTTLSPYPPAIS
jgi:hypothetical protein